MKKTKFLIVTMVLMTIICAFCLKTNVFATEPGDNARTVADPEDDIVNTLDEEGEPVVTSDEEGEPVAINEESNAHSYETNYNIYNGDLYIVSNESEYVMDQLVDGNVFILGNNVTITGQVNGSVFVCAKSVTIESEAWLGSSVFAIASNIIMKGMSMDLYSISQSLEMDEDAYVYRDVRAAAQDIKLAGFINRNAYLKAKTIEVPEDASKLTINGNLEYEAEKELEVIDGESDENTNGALYNTSVMGEIKYSKYVETERDTADIVLDYIFSAVGTIVFDVLVYLCLLFLAPKFIEKSKEYVSTRGLLAFAIGLAFTIVVPVVALLLAIINIGAGISALLLFIYAVVLMINAFIVAIVANEFVASKLSFAEDKFKKGLLLIPVSLVIWALRKLPIIGTWISIIVFLCGVGIVLLYQFDKRRKEKTE